MFLLPEDIIEVKGHCYEYGTEPVTGSELNASIAYSSTVLNLFLLEMLMMLVDWELKLCLLILLVLYPPFVHVDWTGEPEDDPNSYS